MKIKRAPKKNPSTNAGIAAFIILLNTCENEELPNILRPIVETGWNWPRTDLQHWISPLNRFDTILEDVIRDYDLGSMQHCQTNSFTPRTKELVTSILAFEKVLLENSTNRKIYASFDRLNDLLHTTDVDILLATLRLGLRPAQQFSGAATGSSFGIADQRLLSLAQGWGTREFGLEMVDLAGETITIPAALEDLEWQFYKKAVSGSKVDVSVEKKEKGKELDGMDEDDSAPPLISVTATPTPKPRATFAAGSLLATPIPATPSLTSTLDSPTEGLTSVLISSIRTNPKSAVDLLVDAIETYDVPESDRLHLLQKIRIAKSLDSATERRTMLVVRLLAIAVFAHTNNESFAQSKLFLYEPELIPQLAELVHPDRAVPIEIQAAAFYALDALAKFKTKISEVAAALNASVSHGILMYVLRRTVNDLAGDNPISTHEFIDSLFNILTFFQTSAFVGNMIVGAGVVSLLVEIVKNQRRDRIPVVIRAIAFLDSLMYGYSSAFTLFGTAGGLPIFVERVKHEIEICVAAHSGIVAIDPLQSESPTGLLSFDQAALLKALLRAVQRLMQTAGTTEGLRNLIDSTLLTSVKALIVNRAIFGPQLFGLAINITATFVHNEPTCLNVIQEAKVPDALYDAIEDSIPASIDVLQAIPNAIGALCLNPVGLEQFNQRPIISKFFKIFSSEKHVRILQDRDNGNMIGASFDELVRHHPTLKDKVLGATMEALAAIRDQGREFVPEKNGEGYQLQFDVEPILVDTPMTAASASTVVVDPVVPVVETPAKVEVKDNHVLTCIDVMGRFLEGLFQNLAHCKDFVKLDPFNLILDLFALPCTPFSMPGTSAFVSLCSALRIISEVKAPETVDAILVRVKSSLETTRSIWSGFSSEAKTKDLVSITVENFEERNKSFRSLSGLLTFIALLSDVYANLSYTHGRVASTVLLALCNPAETEILLQLGEVYRFSVWEGLMLNKIQVAGKPNGTGDANLLKDTFSTVSAASPHAPNVKSLHEVVTSLPLHIVPFFQSVIKLFVHRRISELASHRKASAHLSKTIAAILKGNLKWLDSNDTASQLTYLSNMMSNVESLVMDDRSAQGGVQVLQLVAFQSCGGVVAYVSLYSRLEAIASESLENPLVEDSKPELGLTVVQVFAALKVALDSLQRLSSHRMVLDSPQTALLVAREKDKTSDDYFSPSRLIIKLRAEVIGAVMSTWSTSWLTKAPPNVVRGVISTLLNIIRAEGESPEEAIVGVTGNISRSFFTTGAGVGPPALGGGLPAGLAAAQAQPFALDQARVTQLVDMGFPRRAAESVLIRCRNNLSIATEYLLSHPDVVGAARIAETAIAEAALLAPPPVVAPIVAEPVPVAAPVVETPNQVEATPDVVMDNAGIAVANLAKVESTIESVVAKLESAVQELRAILSATREPLKSNFLARALVIAEEFPDVIFEIKGAFNLLGPGEDDTSLQSLQSIIDDIEKNLDNMLSVTPSAAAIRFRLIALLASDAVYREPLEETREQLMKILYRAGEKYLAAPTTKEDRPLWLASSMLLADSLFSLAEVPVPTTILAADDTSSEAALVCQGPDWGTERDTYLKVAIDVLTKGVCSREVFLSTLRLLLVLTRDHGRAATFVQQDGLRSLFTSVSTERVETQGCRPYAIMILRHVIESKEILQPAMEREIEAWFAAPRAPVGDITGFLRGVGSIAFRNVPIFLEATKATCKLVRPDATSHYHLTLINHPTLASKTVEAETAIASTFAGDGTSAPILDMQVDESIKPASGKIFTTDPSVETAIHFLMSEIMESTKTSTPIIATIPITPIPTEAVAVVAVDAVVPVKMDEAEMIAEQFHSVFTMSCLAELIASYSICKASFFSFSKKSAKDSTSLKLRSSFLVHLLNEVIPVPITISAPMDTDLKKRVQHSQWASLIIVSLCFASKESSTDLTTVRKVVLDAISKAYKDAAASTESTEIRYGRIFSLSDLCSRILTCRPFQNATKSGDETSMQLAKLMLEKNFAVILTNALADVDLNYPSVNNLINSILRPLEQLTKVVTKVGRAKPSLPTLRLSDEESSSFDEGEEQEIDTEEEEAPDLYRNSALGMYEGELEPGHMEDAYMSGDSAEDYDEDDEDMEDIEDGLPGSDVSDVSVDEDEMRFEQEIGGITTDEHEDEEDDDDEDDDNDSDINSGEELEMDDDEDEILITGDEDGEIEGWEDQPDDDEEGLEDEEAFDHGALLQDEEDEDNSGEEFSDEEQMYLQGELEFDAEMNEQAPNRGSGWDAIGALNAMTDPRRSRLDDMLPLNATALGRSRPGQLAVTATNPLLIDSPSGNVDAPSRRQRGDGSRGTPEYNDWVRSIEQMLGGGAIEQLQQLLSSHGMARIDSPNQIRIQPNPGPEGGLSVVLDPPPQPLAPGARAGRNPPALSAAARIRNPNDRSPPSFADLLPATTIQRWTEEGRICQGSILVAERVARLVNHVINELHGPARFEATRLVTAELERAKERNANFKASPVLQSTTAPATSTPSTAPVPMEDVSSTGEEDEITRVMNLARSLATVAALPTPTPVPVQATPAPALVQPVEAAIVPVVVEAAPESDEIDEEPEAGPVDAPERVTIVIHGETLDITETGIDPTFLEALPDDMREEVLNQHFRESRSAAPPQAVPSSINSEFLEALPPDLRAEVLRQELAEQRREQSIARAAAARAAGEEVVEEGGLLGALDRQMQGEQAVAGAAGPAALGGEVDVLRTLRRIRELDERTRAGIAPVAGTSTTKKAPVHREAIQLLDKSGLATLVRLLFFPQPLKRNALQKVLVNLCENSRTRMELINLLLIILQDGTRDVTAVDKSFSQMSLRASKSLGLKETPRRKTGVDVTPGGALPHFPGESVPNLIAQRCLEALMFLVSSNEQSPLFFLTEQEVVIGASKRSSKKGKGKEKAVTSTAYPIIILLGLLDRPALLKTQSMMDSLTLLLSTITKSLSVLQKKAGEVETQGGKESLSEALHNLETALGTATPTIASESTPAEIATKPVKDLSPSEIISKNPPILPPAIIQLVVNVLDAGECSSKTFQQTLVLIQNLSYLPEAREVISEELQVRAQRLCSLLVPDLNELFTAIKSTDDVRGVTLAKFSPASSLQAKLLRILKTIDWLHSPPKKGPAIPTDPEDDPMLGNTKKLTPGEEKVSAIYENFTIAGLWQQLGDCLAGIEAKPELLFIATVLLPLIESLMVVSKYVGSRKNGRDALSPQAMSPREMEVINPDSMESIFISFTDEHRKILNTMVRNNPTLMSGSFAILIHNPKVLEFDNKRSYFFSRLHDRSQRQRNHYGPLQVNVRRQYVFEDSFHNLQRRSGDEIKHGKLSVRFYDEEGVDAGGVTREWFSVLARQMFNPGYALFQPQAADALTYQPNKSSSINPEHLLFFKFVGRIIGKALHDQRLLEAYFSRSVYKHMLGKPVDHRDLESIDPEYHKSLVWMLENDIDGVLDLTFSVERDDFGITEIVDLIVDGRNVAVTNENKAEYVRLIADHRLTSEIKDQISALLKGLYEIVPKDLLQIFSERELELLISGLPEIDVDEWRANTDLHNFSASDPVIGYFWRAVRSFTHEERAKLLQFVSGSSRVPLEGFAALQGMSGITKFSITSAGGSGVNRLPTAHTCFNQVDLPPYESYEELRKQLLYAITEGSTGFSFS